MPRVSVVILSWNGRHHLETCLSALAVQTYRDFETILVDNGSSDGTAAYVREAFPWVRLLELPHNTGFAGGNNRGLALATGEFIVTLNNDTRVEPGFLAALVDAVETSPNVGMVAAKMLNFYQAGRIDSVGIAPITGGMGINRGVGEGDHGQYDQPEEVFGPCAGAALYRRAMVDEVGFFDEDFFAYYEDLDLAWRGRLAGWRAVTAPTGVVYHVHSATCGRMSPFTVYQVQRNKWYVLLKNWPLSLLLRHLPRIIVYDLAALVLALVKGRLVPALKARLMVVAALPSLLHKRKKVAGLIRVSTADITQQLVANGNPLATLFRKMGSGV